MNDMVYAFNIHNDVQVPFDWEEILQMTNFIFLPLSNIPINYVVARTLATTTSEDVQSAVPHTCGELIRPRDTHRIPPVINGVAIVSGISTAVFAGWLIYEYSQNPTIAFIVSVATLLYFTQFYTYRSANNPYRLMHHTRTPSVAATAAEIRVGVRDLDLQDEAVPLLGR